MANWWYVLESEKRGPVDAEALKKLILSKSIGPQTFIWTKGMAGWRKLYEIDALKALLEATPPPIPKDDVNENEAKMEAQEPLYISTTSLEDQPKRANHSSDSVSTSPSNQAPEPRRNADSNYPIYKPAKSWPRFFARIFDLWWEVLCIGIIIFVVGYILDLQAFTDWIADSSNDMIFGLLCIFLALGLDAAVYGFFGNTPGKALLGLRVETVEGKRLPSNEYISRNLRVWATGIFFGLPFLYLITMAWQSGRLSKGKQATYDEALECRVHAQHRGWVSKAVFVFLFISLFAIVVYGYSSRSYQSSYTARNYASTGYGQQQRHQNASPRERYINGMQIAARKINSKAPITIDDYTRLDKAKVGPGARIAYFYTLTSIPSYQVDPRRLKKALLPNLVKRACSNDNTRTGLRLGVKYVYIYRGNDGVEIMRVAISQSSC